MIDGHTPRWSASILVAAAAHAAIFAMLAGSAMVRLEIEPARIELAFLEASDRTAGPGDPAPELRVAAPPAAPPPATEPARREDPVAAPDPPIPAPAAPLDPAPVVERRPKLQPKPDPRPQPKGKAKPAPPVSPPPAAATHGGTGTGTAAASATARTTTGSAAAGTTPGGTDARSTAPAWAPSARVRYEQLLFAWMERHKQYPMLAQRRGIEGEGSVRVRIDRSGRVLEHAVTRSTGEKILDQAALDMVRRANPFPALPSEYAAETFEFDAPIRYRLR